ncbi:MAG: DUF1294 domain-containing protein [Campylobacterota bacterium]|nr:DUF1294 domain-containing protein [Campylobacterota bacterium]
MIDINFSLSYLEIYLICINIFSFIYYGYDKLQAIRSDKNISRVSEKALITVSFIGGTMGAVISMVIFRHKIKKLSFMVKFTIVVLVQVLVCYFKGDIYEYSINI